MPIDTSIYNAVGANVNPLLNPLDVQAKQQHLAAMQNQNRLADLVFGEKQREAAGDNALAGLLAKGLKPEEVASGLASAGYGNKSLAYTKQQQELLKQQAEVGETKAKTKKMDHETASHQFELAGQLASSWVTDPAINKQKIQSGLASALHAGIISPEIAQAKLAELQGVGDDPASLSTWSKGTLAQVMKAKESMSFIAPDANTVANNKTSRENNAASNAVAMRGQNMTDARGRESNEIQRQAGRTQVVETPEGFVLVDKGTGTARPATMGDGRPVAGKDKLPEAQQKQVIGVQNLSNAISEYRKELAGYGGLKALSPDSRAAMGTKYNNMMLQAKEAYNLGVLNGPDLDILTAVITDPRSLQGAITSKSALDKQAAELDRIMQGVGQVASQSKPRVAAPAAASAKPVQVPAGGIKFLGFE